MDGDRVDCDFTGAEPRKGRKYLSTLNAKAFPSHAI